jgi:uncharacterized protein DUF3597
VKESAEDFGDKKPKTEGKANEVAGKAVCGLKDEVHLNAWTTPRSDSTTVSRFKQFDITQNVSRRFNYGLFEKMWRIVMSVFGSIMGAIFGHGSAQANASPTAAPSTPPAQTVDVAAIVDKAAAAKGEKLAWRTSIVDLMNWPA